MPSTPSIETSRRLLSLLSLLQSTREWSGSVLAERLHVSERTVRRDVDRLRELGYRIEGTKGRDGGYRLDAGAVVPPMLFDDEQAVAIAIALRGAATMGVDVAESAQRALSTMRRVLPSRLRARIDAIEMDLVATDRSRRSRTFCSPSARRYVCARSCDSTTCNRAGRSTRRRGAPNRIISSRAADAGI